MKKFCTSLAIACLPLPAIAHEYLTFDELTEAFGMDFENTTMRAETVAPGLHVLFGAGGNIIASIGGQGTLLVDSQFPQLTAKIRESVRSLGGADIAFTINTHWHFDHADGNAPLGRDGTWFVSHANTRRMLAGDHPVDLVSVAYLQPAAVPAAMPVITYEDRMQMHFNGDTLDLLHFGPAHTTGDTAVYFRAANVVHMGDVFNASYPFIDAGNGGSIDGMILFCERVLAVINEDTVVVPGHGPVSGYADLAAFIDMLETVRNRVDAMIDRGMSLDDVVAARPTAEFDERYGDPARLLDRAYTSLSR